MARLVLTDKAVENAKPAPPGTRSNLWDALVPSLALRITDKGHKSWVIQRRVNGRMARISLGEYPAVELVDARERARSALEDLQRGRDPRQTKARVTATVLRKDTFEGAVETYIAREVEKNRRPRTQDEITRPLRKLFIPKWGTLPLKEISARDIIEVLDELVDADKPIAANRAYSVVRRFFRWAVERHLIAANPATSVRRPSKETSRDRVLSDEELREVWIHAGSLGWPFGPLVRVLMLTGQRRNEIAGMSWTEIDAKHRTWTLPAGRAKNAREHVVPLAKAVEEILAKAPRFKAVDDNGVELKNPPVFTTTGRTCVSGFSRAKDRLDILILEARQKLAAENGEDPKAVRSPASWVIHDLRRSCATGMARLGVQPHIIEVALNHAGGFRAGVAGVYQRHPYLEERRDAFDRWAVHVKGLTEFDDVAAKVVNLRDRR